MGGPGSGRKKGSKNKGSRGGKITKKDGGYIVTQGRHNRGGAVASSKKAAKIYLNNINKGIK